MKTVLKGIGLGLLVAAALQINAADASAAVFTSFETTEGFTPGGRSNTAGWSTSNSTRVRVSNGTGEPALDGSYSMRLEAPSTGTATVVAYNWEWADAAERLDTYSFSFTNPDATYLKLGNVAWVYIRLADETSVRNLQFYVRYGNESTDPHRIAYKVANGSDSLTDGFKNIEQSSMNFADWNTLTVTFDFEAKTYSLTLQGTSATPIAVASNIALPSSWNVTGIIGTQLVSPGTGTVYYDSLNAYRAIPEPSTLGMFGLGVLLFVGWNARRLVLPPLV
ncbi:MAG TPA: PEP-CTERM sorting domain-containing protein [Chthoniobacteraceae bacterium]|nr:PEP-CTERM sorting domain-containing protein [Chthoniobacteraceae bacterium]